MLIVLNASMEYVNLVFLVGILNAYIKFLAFAFNAYKIVKCVEEVYSVKFAILVII